MPLTMQKHLNIILDIYAYILTNHSHFLSFFIEKEHKLSIHFSGIYFVI